MKLYRTAATLLLFGAMVIAVLVFCPKETRPAVAPVAIGALVALGTAQSVKSGFQHHVEAKAAAAAEVTK